MSKSIIDKFTKAAQTKLPMPDKNTSEEDYNKWKYQSDIEDLRNDIKINSETIADSVKRLRHSILMFDDLLKDYTKKASESDILIYRDAFNEFNNYSYTIQEFEDELITLLAKFNPSINKA